MDQNKKASDYAGVIKSILIELDNNPYGLTEFHKLVPDRQMIHATVVKIYDIRYMLIFYLE